MWLLSSSNNIKLLQELIHKQTFVYLAQRYNKYLIYVIIIALLYIERIKNPCIISCNDLERLIKNKNYRNIMKLTRNDLYLRIYRY